MKFPIDLVLISLLIVLMYYQPDILASLTTSVLGRMIAVCLVAHIALAYGRNAGLLAALIFILLLHNKRKGSLLLNLPRKKRLRRRILQMHQVYTSPGTSSAISSTSTSTSSAISSTSSPISSPGAGTSAASNTSARR